MTWAHGAGRAELWFDVEKRYKTIRCTPTKSVRQLWFDVEKRYKTIHLTSHLFIYKLWFDVEKRYKTMAACEITAIDGCGLM